MPKFVQIVLVVCTFASTINAGKLHTAVATGDINEVNKVIHTCGADDSALEKKLEKLETIENLDPSEVFDLYQAHFKDRTLEINERDENNFAPIHHTLDLEQNYNDILGLLLGEKADPDLLFPSGESVLHRTVKHKNFLAVEKLLEHSAKTTVIFNGKTPYEYALHLLLQEQDTAAVYELKKIKQILSSKRKNMESDTDHQQKSKKVKVHEGSKLKLC